VPPVAVAAYERAVTAARTFDPPCDPPLSLLAAVGEIESQHGTAHGREVDGNGTVRPPLYGPSVATLRSDSDGGRWDGSAQVDRAVGPMQIIPATWAGLGLGGGADPNNLFDSALAASILLCEAGAPLRSDADRRAGLFGYNHSAAYVDQVLAAAARLEATPPVGEDPVLVDVAGIGLTNVAWAHRVKALLAAASADGVTLLGSSYRGPARQVALRRAHCGDSTYAIYEMPASACSPPTARPGTSRHEVGLAIDFEHCSSRRTACFQWLARCAAAYGLVNLPSEPWHWSDNGR
jgi:hypothetical protein